MGRLALYRLNDADLSDEGVAQVLSDDYTRSEVSLRPGLAARLFVTRSEPRTPEWLDYLTPIARQLPSVPPSETLGAVLLIKPHARQRLLYAATWGIGHFLLRAERLQPDLGLRCALNLLSADDRDARSWNPVRLRSLRAKRIGPNTLITQSQFARHAPLESFPFSVDADQLRAVTGTPLDTEGWGKSVTGGVSLHLKRPESPASLVSLCQEVDRAFLSNRYKAYFAWIDNVSQITDPELLTRVRGEIVRQLAVGEIDGLSLAPPAIVSWEEISKFEYQLGYSHAFIEEEPSLISFREFLVEEGLLASIDAVTLQKRARLHALNDAGDRIESWTIANCLTGEIQVGRKSYIVDEGALFMVAPNYLQGLNRFADHIPVFRGILPNAARTMKEGPYNARLASTLTGALLLDKLTVTGKGTTAIEVCDVALKTRKLIHVKKGTSSATLSHLFSQAAVSAELLHMDPDFRQRVHQRLQRGVTGSGAASLAAFKWLYGTPFQPARCEVVMAIMTGRPRRRPSLLLPFFSKVNLRMRCDDLRRMGYPYSFAQITTR